MVFLVSLLRINAICFPSLYFIRFVNTYISNDYRIINLYIYINQLPHVCKFITRERLDRYSANFYLFFFFDVFGINEDEVCTKEYYRKNHRKSRKFKGPFFFFFLMVKHRLIYHGYQKELKIIIKKIIRRVWLPW